MSARRGFALIAALWLLVALSAFALELAATAHTRRLSAANARERTAALAAADAGIEQAFGRLYRLRFAQSTQPGGPEVMMLDPWFAAAATVAATDQAGPFRYRVTLHSPGAQLDLNHASEEQLRRLMAALRIDAGQADRAIAGILDWRDADDLPRLHGAERDDYVRIGSATLPSNGPFTTISELPQVIGVTQAIYERVRPYLTVVGSGVVNVNVAERPVLLTLPGVGEEAVAALLALRSRGGRVEGLRGLAYLLPSDARERLIEAIPELDRVATTYTSELVVTSEAWLPDGSAHARVDALVVRDPFVRVVWRRVR